MSNKKYLIVVGGATASGKTAVAIALARHFETEILSADSRQFFREMSIGTAKPTAEELAAAKHYFVNNLSIHDAYSVGEFEREALRVLADIFSEKNVAVMVGGTGLYLRAVCDGLDDFPEVPLSIRRHFEQIFENEGIEPLQNLLQTVDSEYFATVDRQNAPRLIRALSVWKVSGKPFSSFRTGAKVARNFEPIYIALDLPRTVLYEKINQRVDAMIANGLLEEARQLIPFQHLNALQTVGYSELFDHFDGKISLEEAIEKIKQHTRNYAKRQTTWFKKNDYWTRFAPSDVDKMVAFISEKIKPS